MPQEHIIQLLLDLLRFDETPVRPADLEPLSQADWQAIYDLALRQKVVALLYHRLKVQNLLDAVPEHIQQSFLNMYRQNAVRNMKIYHEFAQIAAAFQANSIPLIVLKGVYLAEVIYQNIALRQMGDMDLLVHKEDLASASEIVMKMGYQPLTPFSLAWEPTFNHLPRLVKPNAADVEIHWSITTPKLSPKFNIQEFWEEAKAVKIANTELLALSPEDVLLYLCFHNAKHSFEFTLRTYVDIQAFIQHFFDALNWEQLLQRAKKWGWERGVYLTLRLASELVGANVPDTVLENLRPSDFDIHIIQAARQQLFLEKYSAASVGKTIARTVDQGILGVLRIFVQRIFIPRSELANKYLVPPDSKRIYFYYPVRFINLILRHSKTMWNIHIRKKGADAAKRQGILVTWIEDE